MRFPLLFMDAIRFGCATEVPRVIKVYSAFSQLWLVQFLWTWIPPRHLNRHKDFCPQNAVYIISIAWNIPYILFWKLYSGTSYQRAFRAAAREGEAGQLHSEEIFGPAEILKITILDSSLINTSSSYSYYNHKQVYISTIHSLWDCLLDFVKDQLVQMQQLDC